MIDEDNADLAIVGLACRFPGARDSAEFWRNLAGGVESITQLTDEEILASGVPAAHLAAPGYVKAAAVIDQPGGFDAAFFGFVPSEARMMDPQQRLLLELAHTALEDAGCDPARYPGRVGVFAGSAMNTYFMHAGLDQQFAQDYIPTLIVNDKDFLATRISYKLNLKGPSLTVQTACSTSLVAVHLARQSLLSEETDMALVGAVSIRAPHRAGYLADAGGVSSPDGHVRAFDAAANGTLFGSGGGVIVLKRLRDAVADGDTIRAIIKGSAVNNDGSEKAGYTAPSVNSQADAIVEALANADVEAETISYIEAHGSGTPVGDPIEVRALTKAFRSSTTRTGFCAIGSVKTNIGHLDAAAGLAGLIKTVLAMEHRQLPPSLNYSRPNPEIDFPTTPFFVNTRLTPWAPIGVPRRAGIMSTGMGGTNAHVVLEEAPSSAATPATADAELLILSARTESALTAATDQLRQHLEANPTVSLSDVAATLQTGRRAMPHRRFAVGSTCAALVASLAAPPKRLNTGKVREGAKRPIMMLLPGVGDHYVGMGRELYLKFPAFRREVDRCAAILQPLLGEDIREILYPKNRDWQKTETKQGLDLKKMLAGNVQAPEDADSKRLGQALFLQPALFTVEYALAGLWKDLGVVPDAYIGHSLGEYVAGCLSGVFSLEDALRLIVRRVQLVDTLPAASMLAVPLPEGEVLPLLPSGVSISLINGPALCIVAGDPAAVQDFAQTLTARGVLSRAVQNTHAFHSRMLDPVVPAFEAEVRKAKLNRPKTPFISNVTGQWITDAQAVDPTYWGSHLNRTARFNDALATMWLLDGPILLEAGPGKTLGVLSNQHPAKGANDAPLAIWSLRHHYENQGDVEVLLNSVGRMWIAGTELQWNRLPAPAARRKIPLPTYPFERQDYWLTAETSSTPEKTPVLTFSEPGLLPFEQWFHTPSWERTALIDDGTSDSSGTDLHWLIFSDRFGNDHGLCSQVERAGSPVEFVRLDASVSYEKYLNALRRIRESACRKIRIIHLGCVASDVDPMDAGAREAAQDFGFFSVMQLAQAVGELNIEIPIKLAIVSTGFHAVIGTETLNPTMTTVLGACGVIPKEFPNIACFNIDLESNLPQESHRSWLVSEFSRAASGDVLAYRGRYRWRRAYQSVTIPPTKPVITGQTRPDRLRDGGVYLITGGTGGIGLAVAKHLAQTCRARIVLTKKSAFPSKVQWQERLNSETTPPAEARILRELVAIEALGSPVEVVTAEVSDRESMRRVLITTREKFGVIHGVIHGAGIVRPGLIQTKERQSAENVFAPKVAGAWVLHDLLRGAELDFLVLFSSITAVITPFAEADYSGANAFLDCFAQYCAAECSYPVISINWPGWKEAGQLAALVPAPGTESWKESALQKAILSADGVEAFHRALGAGLSQVIVSPTDLQQEMRHASGPALPSVGDDSPLEAAGDDVESVIREIWSKAFGIPQIGVDERFTDLGGHSLLALQIVTRIRALYGVDIALRDFFEASTISQLSTVIQDKLISDIANLTDEEVQRLIASGAQTSEQCL